MVSGELDVEKTPQNFYAHLEDEQTEAPADENNLPEAEDVERWNKNSHLGLSEFKSGSLILKLYNSTHRDSCLVQFALLFSSNFLKNGIYNRVLGRKKHVDDQSFSLTYTVFVKQ